MMKISYDETLDFQKDFKKLVKRYTSLKGDFELVKEAVIELYHVWKIDNKGIFLIPGFCSKNIKICKIKKFACDALKNKGSRSGIRIIYAFHCIELKVVFLEIYYKGDKEKEDYNRIKTYLKN